MNCELCLHEEVIPGRKLCPICGEAIERLAMAVKAIEARASQERVVAQTAYDPEDYATAREREVEEYKSAFLGGR